MAKKRRAATTARPPAVRRSAGPGKRDRAQISPAVMQRARQGRLQRSDVALLASFGNGATRRLVQRNDTVDVSATVDEVLAPIKELDDEPSWTSTIDEMAEDAKADIADLADAEAREAELAKVRAVAARARALLATPKKRGVFCSVARRVPMGGIYEWATRFLPTAKADFDSGYAGPDDTFLNV